VVEEVIDGAVNAEVTLSIGEGAKIVAVITRQSVERWIWRRGGRRSL